MNMLNRRDLRKKDFGDRKEILRKRKYWFDNIGYRLMGRYLTKTKLCAILNNIDFLKRTE